MGDMTTCGGPLVHGGRFERQFFEDGLYPFALY